LYEKNKLKSNYICIFIKLIVMKLDKHILIIYVNVFKNKKILEEKYENIKKKKWK